MSKKSTRSFRNRLSITVCPAEGADKFMFKLWNIGVDLGKEKYVAAILIPYCVTSKV